MGSFLNTRERKKVISLSKGTVKFTTAKVLRRIEANKPTKSLAGDKKTFTVATRKRARKELRSRGLKI